MTLQPPPAFTVGPNVFRRTELVRFAHCDAAGIVFFPQFHVLVNGQVEDWFNDALGIGYAALIHTRRIGFPTVSLNTEFTAPCRLGEKLTLSLSVDSIGRSSLKLTHKGTVRDRTCFISDQVLVAMSFDDYRPVEIPEDLRARLEAFRAGVEPPGDAAPTGPSAEADCD